MVSALFVIGVPLLAALALLWRRARAGAIAVAPWTAVPALVLALGTPVPWVVDVPWLLLGTRLGLDATARVFLAVSALLWIVCGVYAARSPGQVRDRARFFAFFLSSLAGNVGVLLAADVVTFFFSFSVMSFASCGLVMHDRRGDMSRAGRVYVGFVAFGEALLFIGIVGLAWAQGHTGLPAAGSWASVPGSSIVWFGFVLAGFGVKMGAVPLHMWAPLAYRAAPVAAAAALSGPMLLAGLLGWLRFLPLGTAAVPTLGGICLAGGFASAFWGVLAGLAQRDPRALLGYSSVSQMGLVAAAIGTVLRAPDGWPAALPSIWLFAVHHAMAKTALVLGVGEASGTTGRRPGRLLAALLLVPAVAIAGVPLSSGAASKTALKHVLNAPADSATLAASLLSIASVGTTLLMLRYLALVWPRGQHRTSRMISVPWMVLVISVAVWVWVPWWNGLRTAAFEILSPVQVWETLWPVALGLSIAWWACRVAILRIFLLRIRVAPGDIIVPLVDGARTLARTSMRLSSRMSATAAGVLRAQPLILRSSVIQVTRGVEAGLQRWDVAGALIVALSLAIAGLLLSA